LNSQFSILNSQFSILNSQFSILNSQFSILNSQFSILNSQLARPRFATKQKTRRRDFSRRRVCFVSLRLMLSGKLLWQEGTSIMTMQSRSRENSGLIGERFLVIRVLTVEGAHGQQAR